jgi:hypothetical protein
MSESKILHEEQTIYLGNGWTLRARIERGMEETPHGRVGSNEHVLQFAITSEKHPHGVKITPADAQALLALRGVLGTTATIPIVAPEKASVQVSPAVSPRR